VKHLAEKKQAKQEAEEEAPTFSPMDFLKEIKGGLAAAAALASTSLSSCVLD
jgi:hypothetical protein